MAFEPIVASGVNATILHHPTTQQTKAIEADELVLFDLGYSFNGYHADISRTYPVSGTFNDRQREIYLAVYNCNLAVIDHVKPGLSLLDLQEYAINTLKVECLKRGLIENEDDIYEYFIHSVSHFLGLDTHDVGTKDRKLVAGNVITVEPGLYFVEDGIGVRIEDDVLVTETGAVCLSNRIKKELSDVERLLKNRF